MVSEENASQEVTSQQEKSTPSPGALLKERREALGLSQQEIASKLFLKTFQINDLENDVIDEKSSVTFTKGYVRNYAKQLGLPSHDVIEAFERFHNQSEVPSSDKLQSFSKRVAKQTHDDRWMMVTYIILLIIIGGVVLWCACGVRGVCVHWCVGVCIDDNHNNINITMTIITIALFIAKIK